MIRPTEIKAYLIIAGLCFLHSTGKGHTSSGELSVDTAENRSTEKKMIPYVLPWDDMPIDLSFVYEDEKPAGKRGFLQIEGDKYLFEDGTEARFWGTNFNAAQNFPSHEHSEKVARRLAKVGVNLVRLHQLDAEWSTPNIFNFNRGKNKPNTLSFDPESMDRLDYLIYCLKKEGIYVYMDLLNYRRFRTADGVASADELGDAAKPHSTYSRKLIELQKQFNEQLWNHINPYTGMAYKHDPVIVLAGITNENDLMTLNQVVLPQPQFELEPYRSELEDLYRKWASQKNIPVGKEKVAFDREKVITQEFFKDVTVDYYREMINHMRELGVRIPISGTNWTINTAHLIAQSAADFTESHRYWYNFGLWKDGSKRFISESMTGDRYNIVPHLAFNSVQGKPFFVSEWDSPWPNEWRAESPLLVAAVGNLQGWGGFAIHTYRYSLDEDVDMLAKPTFMEEAISNRYHRAGSFDSFNDPAKFGLFYHAALITRRGDVRMAEKTLNIVHKDLLSRPRFGKGALALTAEKHRIKAVLPGQKAAGDIQVDIGDRYIDENEVLSDTEELYRNLDKKIGWINTPMTKAVYGFLGKQDKIKLTDVNIDVKTDFATVAISSLTDEPINRSDNLLLTAVGRAENSNMKFNDDRNQLLDVGHGPVRIEVIDAKVSMETNKRNLRVMAVSSQGLVTGYMPSEYKDGVFSFEIGGEFSSMYYLIQEL